MKGGVSASGVSALWCERASLVLDFSRSSFSITADGGAYLASGSSSHRAEGHARVELRCLMARDWACLRCSGLGNFGV